MADTDTHNCELTSEKCYKTFDNVEVKGDLKTYCDSEENLLNVYPDLKNFCYKLVSNVENLKEKKYNNLNNNRLHLQLWLQDNVFKMVERKSIILYIVLFDKLWRSIMDKNDISNKNEYMPKYYNVGIDYRAKWKKMFDFNFNYKEIQCAFQNKEDCKDDCNKCCKENCRENYCKYILDIFNINNEFEHVCNRETYNQTCPEFWNEFKKNYKETSDIESKCKEIYDKLGFYKVKMSLDIEGEEKYVEQYESTYMFSFFEKLIGYSIKYYLSKTIHYSKYVLLPILSFFGSKIAPKADDMRNMWRNVQGVTNPASLLNPMKPPGGGNKMGLPYLPK
ncbi:PIR Superfamily Protein [Plasmodium ovale curtisi]|uniref:PIR Superfamily Protein n=1 Tax=Plasmodium ovale curtisi TaxID=864141 RepID=A0A1A8X7A5_PLAOA|nr:PIR Superfamily Protein [Plasmodium ovale curtisi]